jgi:hypothetical protein
MADKHCKHCRVVIREMVPYEGALVKTWMHVDGSHAYEHCRNCRAEPMEVELCPHCPHPTDEHLLVTGGAEAREMCNHAGCDCPGIVP